MPLYAGIDLGTTNSVVCLMTETGVVPVEVDGEETYPSALLVENGAFRVGRAAKNMRLLKSDRCIVNAKTAMPDGKQWVIDGRTYTPADAAREVLRKAVQAIREASGSQQEIRAVVTVPACFSSAACAATRQAAEEAGLTLLRLLPEPDAAAFAYAADSGETGNILVVDTGGGTFDLALVSPKEDGSMNCIAVGGDNRLGGNDFDRVILEQFLLPNVVGEADGDPEHAAMARQELEDIAAAIKEELQGFGVSRASRSLGLADGRRLQAAVTAQDYRQACGRLRMRMAIALEALTGSCSRPIDRVLLVGGMARDANILEVIRGELPEKEYRIPENHMGLVAAGAALEAWQKGNGGSGIGNAVTFTDIGIAVDDGDGPHFEATIPRGTVITPEKPAEGLSPRYTNSVAGADHIDLYIYESEGSSRLDACTLCSRLRLIVPPRPLGQNHIRVRMRLNVDRVLEVYPYDEERPEDGVREVVRLDG